MNDNKAARLWFILTSCHIAILSISPVLANDVHLTYIEDDVTLITGVSPKVGSNVNFGIYSHWCLGNINKCSSGITISFFLKPRPANETSSEVVVITSGGHSYLSEGFYLKQRYGDQYEFGISKSEKVWKQSFRLLPNLWSNIFASWNDSAGLQIYVDKHLLKKDVPEKREYEGDSFDPFSEIVIGQNTEGNAIVDQDLFDVQDIVIYDSAKTIEDYPIDDNSYYLGCRLQTTDEGSYLDLSASKTAVNDCRAHCESPVIEISPTKKCRCLSLGVLELAVTDERCTSGSEVGKLYSVSGWTTKHDYRMSVTVEPLHNRSYTKPFETVRIEIETNFQILQNFQVQFGDGVRLNTKQKVLSHFWNSQGVFNISVSASIGKISLTENISFEVKNVDEGIPPEMTVVSATHSKSQLSAEYELLVFDNYDTKCTLSFGDENYFSRQPQHGYLSATHVNHTYTYYGQYLINFNCSNNYGETTNSTAFISELFDIPFLYHNREDSFLFRIHGQKKYLETLTVLRNQEQRLESTVETIGILVKSSDLLPYENLITIKSGDRTLINRIFYVQHLVEEATITPVKRNNAWHLTTNITVQIPAGLETFINCSFGVGENFMFYVAQSEQSLGMMFEVEYPSLGYYPLIVDLSNDISVSRAEDLISVEVPIVSMKLTTSQLIDKTLPVVLNVDLNDKMLGPDKVDFIIRHDDGYTDDISYRSPTQSFTTFQNKHIYEHWGIYTICVTAKNQISEVFQCVVVQVGQNLTHVDLQTSTYGRVFMNTYAKVNITSYTGSDVTYEVDFGDEKFTFTDRQLENGTVTGGGSDSNTNDKSLESNSTLTNATSLEDSKNSTDILGRVVTAIIDVISTTMSTPSKSLTEGTTPTPTKSPIRKKKFVESPKFFAVRGSDEVITVGHLYSKSGRYRVKVKVMNAFSTVKAELCQRIIVDDVDDKNCEKPKIDFANIQSTFARPIQRIRSEEFNITVTSESSCVSSGQFTYSWKAEKFNKGKKEPIKEVCSMESTDNVLVIPAVYLSYGLYRLTVSVAPIGHSLRVAEKSVFLSIEASNPYAEIAGEKETDFLIYANAVFDLNPSRDPDLVTNNTAGLEYDLLCIASDDFKEANGLPFQQIESRSTMIYQDIIFKETTTNPIRLYDYKDCFINVENMTNSISVFDGRLSFPAIYFASEEFVFKLFVSKEGRMNTTTQRVKIKLTNSTDISGQLKAMESIKDAGSLLRAVAVVSGEFLSGGGNDTSDDKEEELTEVRAFMTNLIDKLADKAENLDQCKGMASAVADLTSNPDQTSSTARASGGSAVNKSMSTMKGKFGNANYDAVKDASASAVSGMSNLLPVEDKAEVAAKNRRKKREASQNPSPLIGDGNTQELDSYDLIMKEEDANLHRFFDDLYEFVFIFKKAFRRAVKNFFEIMWINKEATLTDAEKFFRNVIIEWEPFDVEKYLLKYCRHEKSELDKEKLRADKDVATASTGAVDSISGLLLNKMEASRRRRRRRSLPGNGTQEEAEIEGEDNLEQECAINAPGMGLGLKNIDPDKPGPAQMSSSFGSFEIPEGVIPKSADGEGVGTTLVTTKNNPKTWGSNSNGIQSSVLSLDLSGSGGGSKMKVNNTKAPMRLMIQGKAEDVPEPSQWMLCVPRGVSPLDATQWNNHPIPITENDTALHFLLWPDNKGDRFNVYFKHENPPNATHYDFKTSMPHDPSDFPGVKDPQVLNQLIHTFYPPQNMTKLNGSYWVSIGIAKTDVDFGNSETCLNYSTQSFVPSCKFWDEETETWKGDGCKVGNGTTKWNTECLCTHLTSFGGDFAVPPNTIDFSNVWAKFANLNENAAVFSTVVALIGVYIILLIWSRYMDKRDIIKWGATPLEDNLPSDNYHYQMTVQTGVRKNASTTSKVSFIVSGENGDSGVRRLYDGHRKELESGSILNYICSVERPLGPLTFMRIWHDNSGKGKKKSWFLDQVQITDLQTGDRYIFLCDRWLALEQDDGMVDRILPVAGLEDLVAFKQLFNTNVRKKLSNEHLWFSVFSRPTKSSFTRAQRISCCMSLLFMTMITNAMWFKSDDNAKQSQALKVGPLSFTVQQFFVSFASTMLVFPVNFILITFFKKCRPKQNAVIGRHQQQPKRGKWKNVTNGSQIWGNAAMPSRWKRFKDYISDLVNFKQKAKYGAEDDDPDEDEAPKTRIVGVPEDEKEKKKKKKKPGTLPHWCLYIAWVLCFLSITTAGFFTILYSLEWGKEKANEWLTTFLLSFFQSVIVVQPIKVMFLVAFIACILKKPALDEEDTNEDLNNVIAAHDEEFIGKDNGTIEEIAAKRKEANAEFQPPDPATLEEARQQRLLEIKMEEVLKELTAYIFFVIILFFLSYQQRDSASFTYATNLKNTFTHNFESISTVDQYWVWLETKFIPSLYATHYHNGTRIRRWWEKRCIKDMTSRRVGIPRLRQLRVKPDTCKVNKYMRTLIHHCRDEYGWTDDDAKVYLPGWIKPDPDNITELVKPKNPGPWVYQSSVKLANAPYMATMSTYKGGGYVYMFERNVERTKSKLNELKNLIWMDAHTRAIFVEFTVYNPNINLFGSMIMVIEFLSSGGAVARLECKVFRLLSYVGGLGIMVLIAEVIYAIFSLYFFIRCIRKVKKQKMKYFKEFWNKLEFALLCFCIAVIAMYALKQILTTLAMKALQDPEKADYVNFQSLALYDEMYGFMCGFVVFLATVQFLKLLQFNKKMGMLGETVQYATKDLKVFSIAFLLYFWTFTATGFLLFSNAMISYSNVVGAAESMFAFTLGSFDFVAMQNAQPVLGPIFFFMFILVVYVGLMSIFLTIIADAFSTVKENMEGKQNEYEFIDYFTKRFKQVMGFA